MNRADQRQLGEPPSAQQAIRTGQLITAALAFGQMIFAMVIASMHGGAVFVPSTKGSGPLGLDQPTLMLALVGAGLMVVSLPIGLLMRRRVFRAAMDQGQSSAMALLPATIVAAAMFEGFGLLGLVVSLLAGSFIPGGFYALVSIGSIIAIIPRGSMLGQLEAAPDPDEVKGFEEPQKWR